MSELNVPDNDVLRALIKVSEEEKDLEGLIRVLWYLDEENKDKNTCAHEKLKLSLSSPEQFTKHAKLLSLDTKGVHIDEAFRQTITQVYDEMMRNSGDSELDDNSTEEFDMVSVTDFDLSRSTCFLTLANAWGLIPRSTQSRILLIIPEIVANRNNASARIPSDETLQKIKSGLAEIALSSEAIRNLHRWWSGEITGKRCASNLAGATLPIGVRLAGCIGGAKLGSIAGPMGRFAGCVIGGLLSTRAEDFLSDKMNESLFGIPKDEALENAYNFFGLDMNASDSEVNAAFRKMCLKHHPDKGGKAEDFILVQVNMGVIKCARGQLH